MDIPQKDLARIVKYARAQCRDRCPSERDAEACVALIELCEVLGCEMPECYDETGGFSIGHFASKIKEIEKRRGKPIKEVLEGFRSKGTKTLEDEIDLIDGEFAENAIRAIRGREKH